MQTKTVYDGLLEDKQNKLIEEIIQKKQECDAKCQQLAEKSQKQVSYYQLMYNEGGILCVGPKDIVHS